jgi:hypothetical protein
MPRPQEELIQARGATTTVMAAHHASVHAMEASIREAATVWESITSSIREVEDQATLAKMEVWERVSGMEAESAAALASSCGVVEGFAWRISLLDGELVESHQAQDKIEVNSWNLSDTVVDANRRPEEAERECQE